MSGGPSPGDEPLPDVTRSDVAILVGAMQTSIAREVELREAAEASLKALTDGVNQQLAGFKTLLQRLGAQAPPTPPGDDSVASLQALVQSVAILGHQLQNLDTVAHNVVAAVNTVGGRVSAATNTLAGASANPPTDYVPPPYLSAPWVATPLSSQSTLDVLRGVQDALDTAMGTPDQVVTELAAEVGGAVIVYQNVDNAWPEWVETASNLGFSSYTIPGTTPPVTVTLAATPVQRGELLSLATELKRVSNLDKLEEAAIDDLLDDLENIQDGVPQLTTTLHNGWTTVATALGLTLDSAPTLPALTSPTRVQRLENLATFLVGATSPSLLAFYDSTTTSQTAPVAWADPLQGGTVGDVAAEATGVAASIVTAWGHTDNITASLQMPGVPPTVSKNSARTLATRLGEAVSVASDDLTQENNLITELPKLFDALQGLLADVVAQGGKISTALSTTGRRALYDPFSDDQQAGRPNIGDHLNLVNYAEALTTYVTALRVNMVAGSDVSLVASLTQLADDVAADYTEFDGALTDIQTVSDQLTTGMPPNAVTTALLLRAYATRLRASVTLGGGLHGLASDAVDSANANYNGFLEEQKRLGGSLLVGQTEHQDLVFGTTILQTLTEVEARVVHAAAVALSPLAGLKGAITAVRANTDAMSRATTLAMVRIGIDRADPHVDNAVVGDVLNTPADRAAMLANADALTAALITQANITDNDYVLGDVFAIVASLAALRDLVAARLDELYHPATAPSLPAIAPYASGRTLSEVLDTFAGVVGDAGWAAVLGFVGGSITDAGSVIQGLQDDRTALQAAVDEFGGLPTSFITTGTDTTSFGATLANAVYQPGTVTSLENGLESYRNFVTAMIANANNFADNIADAEVVVRDAISDIAAEGTQVTLDVLGTDTVVPMLSASIVSTQTVQQQLTALQLGLAAYVDGVEGVQTAIDDVGGGIQAVIDGLLPSTASIVTGIQDQFEAGQSFSSPPVLDSDDTFQTQLTALSAWLNAYLGDVGNYRNLMTAANTTVLAFISRVDSFLQTADSSIGTNAIGSVQTGIEQVGVHMNPSTADYINFAADRSSLNTRIGTISTNLSTASITLSGGAVQDLSSIDAWLATIETPSASAGALLLAQQQAAADDALAVLVGIAQTLQVAPPGTTLANVLSSSSFLAVSMQNTYDVLTGIGLLDTSGDPANQTTWEARSPLATGFDVRTANSVVLGIFQALVEDSSVLADSVITFLDNLDGYTVDPTGSAADRVADAEVAP